MKKIFSYKKFWSIFWGMSVIACMAVIFVMSHKPATESAKMSGAIAEWLMKLGVGMDGAVGIETIVRKSAHMLEYFGLCFCICMYVCVRKGRLEIKSDAMILVICILYAISDEVHQLFIEGRAGQVRDVFIDTAGAVVALLFVIIFDMFKRRGV